MADAAEHARAEVEAERRHLLALGVAPQQVSGRRLPVAAGPAIDGIERNQRDKHLAAGGLQDAYLVSSDRNLRAQVDALQRRNSRKPLALPDRVIEKCLDLLVLGRSGVERA